MLFRSRKRKVERGRERRREEERGRERRREEKRGGGRKKEVASKQEIDVCEDWQAIITMPMAFFQFQQ